MRSRVIRIECTQDLDLGGTSPGETNRKLDFTVRYTKDAEQGTDSPFVSESQLPLQRGLAFFQRSHTTTLLLRRGVVGFFGRVNG